MKGTILVFAMCIHLISCMELDEEDLMKLCENDSNTHLEYSILPHNSNTHLEYSILPTENYIDSFLLNPNILHTATAEIKNDNEKNNLTKSENIDPLLLNPNLLRTPSSEMKNEKKQINSTKSEFYSSIPKSNDFQPHAINIEEPKIKFEKKTKTDKKLVSNRLFEQELLEGEQQLIPPLLTITQLFGAQEIGSHSMTKNIAFVKELNERIEFELAEINPNRYTALLKGHTAEAQKKEIKELWKKVKENIHERLINFNLKFKILTISDEQLQYLVKKFVTKAIFHVGKKDLISVKEFMEDIVHKRIPKTEENGLFVFYRYYSGLKLLELTQRKCSDYMSTYKEELLFTSWSEHDFQSLVEMETLSKDYKEKRSPATLNRMMYVVSQHSFEKERLSANSNSPNKLI